MIGLQIEINPQIYITLGHGEDGDLTKTDMVIPHPQLGRTLWQNPS